MDTISKIFVNDIVDYLPDSIKLDQSDPNLLAIPGFSQKTLEVFSILGSPDVKPLSKSFRSLEKNVYELGRLDEKLIKSKKCETRDKILSVLLIAATVSLLAIGIAGVVLTAISALSWWMLLPIGTTLIGGVSLGAAGFKCHHAFHCVSHLKKRIKVIVKADEATQYDLRLQKYLAYYEETLREEINKKIALIQDKSALFDDALKVKDFMNEDIQNLTNALNELDIITNIYNN